MQKTNNKVSLKSNRNADLLLSSCNIKLLIEDLDKVNKLNIKDMYIDFNNIINKKRDVPLKSVINNNSIFEKIDLSISKEKCCNIDCLKYASYYDVYNKKNICWFHMYINN